jgi:hypothetical protein
VLDAECVSNGGTPGYSPNLFRIADLDDDGIPDLVSDRNNYECQGATSAMRSNRYGTTLTIFVGGLSNSVAQVYTGSFYGSRVEQDRDGKPFLTVAETAECGKLDAADSPNSGWKTCGHPVVFDASTQSFILGTTPVADNADLG